MKLGITGGASAQSGSNYTEAARYLAGMPAGGEDGARRRQWRPHIRSPRDIWDEIIAVAQLPATGLNINTASHAHSAADAIAVRRPSSATDELTEETRMEGTGLFLAIIAAAGYFLPTIIALARRKANTCAIFALNLLLGWTFVGWAVALVWALTHEYRRRR